MPPEGPELDAQREVRKNTDQEWQNCLAVITSNTTLDPVSVDIFTKSEEGTTVVLGEDKILEQATTSLESEFCETSKIIMSANILKQEPV